MPEKSSALFQSEHFPTLLRCHQAAVNKPSTAGTPFHIPPQKQKGRWVSKAQGPFSFRPRALLVPCNFLSALEPQKSSALFQTELFPLFQGTSIQR